MTETALKFVDELIAEIGEDGAIALLEEAAKLRSVRQKYLAGDADGPHALVNTIAGWESGDEVPIFTRQLTPYLRELCVFRVVERAATISPDPKLAAELRAAAALLRKLFNGQLAEKLMPSMGRAN